MANKHAFLEKLRAIVLEHYSEEQFGVSDLVEHFGMSRSQMHRKLKSATGQSVSQFIREIRLDEALKLLQKEDTTASEVAYKVGFNSPTYFNTCFNEYFGYPPGESQLQMELAKSNTDSEEPSPAKIPKVRKNRPVVIWFLIITAAVLALFVYKYVNRVETTPISTSEEKEKTIAVLPLKNWSGNVELEYISDGITDAIISKLSGIQAIDRVVPFTSIEQYKDTDKNMATIAEELGVEYILEGNFKLSGDQVQSNLKLIDVKTSKQVWFLEYSGLWKSDEIFELQAAVAENLADKMQVELTSHEKEEINTKPTDNEEAYRLYLKAENQYRKFNKYGFENAIVLYEDAIALDSSFIEPYLGLGQTYLYSGLMWGVLPQQQAWKQAKDYFLKASKLDKLKSGNNSNYINNQLNQGLFYFEYVLSKIEQEYQASLVTGDIVSYDYTLKMGRFDYSIKTMEKQIKLYPLGVYHYMQKAFLHYMLGEKATAIVILEAYDPLYQDNYIYLLETSKWYYYMDEIDTSRKHLTVLLENHKDRPATVYWLSAIHGDIAGESKIVQASLQSLHEQYENSSSGSPAWFIALYYCHIKNYDAAFEWLQKSYERHEVEMTWLKEEPMLRPLRTDPRYIDLYDKVGFSKISPITPYLD